MQITEVRIKLMEEGGERLQAFCSITFDDCFVIRDLKIIEGTNGPFVAMPSRKLTSHCPQCGSKNHLRANHCNDCGARLNANRAPLDEDGRAKLYADIAHPINSACREMIQDRVIREFCEELERAKQPGYVSRYDDFDVDDFVPPRHSRPHGRGHPTVNYTRPGGERGPQSPRSDGAARPPHRATTPAASSASAPTPAPHAPREVQAANDGAAGDRSAADAGPGDSKPKEDFGAGIF